MQPISQWQPKQPLLVEPKQKRCRMPAWLDLSQEEILHPISFPWIDIFDVQTLRLSGSWQLVHCCKAASSSRRSPAALPSSTVPAVYIATCRLYKTSKGERKLPRRRREGQRLQALSDSRFSQPRQAQCY